MDAAESLLRSVLRDHIWEIDFLPIVFGNIIYSPEVLDESDAGLTDVFCSCFTDAAQTGVMSFRDGPSCQLPHRIELFDERPSSVRRDIEAMQSVESS
ncbi:hypothetical protein C475_22419 [Halosimplex carlsbadense 2-9-1]|uniref:Uncharacterized protein n=1 Tax=Halosimplex carlsbadense 2-9-1 TaxID=797114 RepID=M0C934_9EURY|nr:hypothetical protein C475_22419 [Halosimplex carlsbadense 2-9-1]